MWVLGGGGGSHVGGGIFFGEVWGEIGIGGVAVVEREKMGRWADLGAGRTPHSPSSDQTRPPDQNRTHTKWAPSSNPPLGTSSPPPPPQSRPLLSPPRHWTPFEVNNPIPLESQHLRIDTLGAPAGRMRWSAGVLTSKSPAPKNRPILKRARPPSCGCGRLPVRRPHKRMSPNAVRAIGWGQVDTLRSGGGVWATDGEKGLLSSLKYCRTRAAVPWNGEACCLARK
ncbi:hypothetical protein BDK51DRAFT_49185 [Blyttiomyces helicus]|uniref:Uncharacterized protein n=1 Tax=Blyttiomyces helicus TaxID=388810 RepID=A0A4P9W174_9FUNG|nr:hypothetical protein BDK51DRAFT_49185 [Blyttiomyces helicus]|eukprot:RKO84320.1 hypothetical protein BDK51DRAFT_49185 [Blyttiomyces helicus]